MFSFRRSRTSNIAQPADVAAAPTTTEPPVTVETIRLAERDLWRKHGVGVVWSGVAVLLLGALFTYMSSTNTRPDGGSWGVFTSLRFHVSGTSAFAAMAILATVILGLQVAVRTGAEGDSDDESKVIARQRSLARLADACGLAALSVGVVTAVGAVGDWRTLDAFALFGPLGGALLLVVLAADASFASQDRFTPAIAETARALEARSRAELVGRLTGRATTSTRRSRFIQLAVVCAVVLTTAAFSAAWWSTGKGSISIVGTALLQVVLLVSFAFFAATARYAFLNRSYWTALYAYLQFSFVIVIYSAELLLAFGASRAFDTRSLIAQSVLALGFVAVPAALSILLAMRIPGTTWAGLSLLVMIRIASASMKKSDTQPAQLRKRPDPASAIARWALATSLVPPAGFYLAMIAIQKYRRPSKRTILVSRTAVGISATTMVVLLGVVVALAIANPPIST